jgi:hypothetical protein
MAIDNESFELLLASVQRFVRDGWCRPNTPSRSTTRCLPRSSRT